MSLKNRGGTWYFRFRHNGEEIVRTTGLDATKRNKSAALRMEAEARNRLKGGKPVEEDRPDAISFTDAAEAYMKWKEGEHRDHPNTARRAGVSLVALKKFFRSKYVHEITPGDCEKFKTFRRSDDGGAVREVTIRHDLHTLSDFLQYGRKHNWLQDDPLKDVEIPSDAEAVRDYVLSPEDEPRYFRAAAERSMDLHDLARLMLDQGFRPEEVMEFSVFSFNPAAGKLTVASGKSKAAKRSLLLTPESRAIVERRIARAKELNTVWLFPSPRNPQRPIKKVSNAHEDVRQKTGLFFTLYELRHTFATRMGEAGISPQVLMKLLGHSSLRCVMRYCHIGDEAADQAMRVHGGTTGTKRVQKRAGDL